MRGFGSPEELRSYLADQASDRHLRAPTGGMPFPFFGFFGAPLTPSLASPEPMAEMSDAMDAGSAADTNFSTTNIQEIGVDESDIVKNNGQTIYVLDDNNIHIVKADPVEALAKVATVELESSGNSLYLHNNTLVALSHQYNYYEMPMDFMSSAQSTDLLGDIWNDGTQTTVTIVDVTDPANPLTKSTLNFEGSLASSRMIDGRLYLILTTTPRLPTPLTAETIQNMTLEQWLPNYKIKAPDGSVDSGNIVDWQDFYRPESPDGYGITTVITLDVNNPDAGFHSTAVSADAGVIYASTDSLYITDTEYNFNNSSYNEDTIIHKFGFTEDGTEYLAGGIVPGRPLNQYSLGEYQGYLRIATSVQNFSFNQNGLSNSIYVLGQTDSVLEIIGKIENIAPGETIYAARFIADRGYLVTFLRIDPMFIIDLKDPANPKLTGELKVPGYSDHIQLLDQNHLLTVGKDAQDAGSFAWVQGVQLSIFDVTDLTNPQLLHKEIIGGRGTHSEANNNPKAFNYYAPLSALAFPIDLYQGDTSGPQYGQHIFTGLYVYKVTVDNGFELLGRIATIDNTYNNGCFWSYYGFTRGIFMGDNIFSASQTGVKAASLDDVNTTIAQTTFDNNSSVYQDCYPFTAVVDLPMGEGLR